MSFRKLSAPSKLSGSVISKSAITICQNAGKGRMHSVMRLILRPHLIVPAVRWIGHNASIEVEVGEGNDLGILKISPDGDFCLLKVGGKPAAAGSAFALILPVLTENSVQKSPTPCVYEVASDGRSILVTLARWAVPKAVSAPPAPLVTDNAPPYRMGAPSHAEVLKARGVRGA